MNKTIIPKPGKTKTELMLELNKLKEKFRDEIKDNDVIFESITDGYNIKAEKKVLFMNFYIDARITANDGEYVLTWDTNAPDFKVNESLDKVRSILEKT